MFTPCEKTALAAENEGGEISVTGILSIAEKMREHEILIPYNFTGWTTVKNQGRFTKRLSNSVYKMTGVSTTTELMATIGKIAEDNQEVEGITHWDITDDFGWSPGDFRDGGSCYFGSGAYRYARDFIALNNGLAFRIWNGTVGKGRMWIMKDLHDNWFTFNAYGELDNYKKGADLLPALTSMLLKVTGNEGVVPVKLVVEGIRGARDYMYFNNGRGMFLARDAEEARQIQAKRAGTFAKHFDSYGDYFKLEVRSPFETTCPRCGKVVTFDEVFPMLVVGEGTAMGCTSCNGITSCRFCGRNYIDVAQETNRKCPHCTEKHANLRYAGGR